MTSNYRVYGGRHYSYHTMIRQDVPQFVIDTIAQTVASKPPALTIGNETHYSVTSNRHQKLACVHSCDVVLDEVPKNCTDLLELALARRLVAIEQGRFVKRMSISCNQCEALVINGVFCHETGCPNRHKVWDSIEGEWITELEDES